MDFVVEMGLSEGAYLDPILPPPPHSRLGSKGRQVRVRVGLKKCESNLYHSPAK
jgi:hypothetical protein